MSDRSNTQLFPVCVLYPVYNFSLTDNLLNINNAHSPEKLDLIPEKLGCPVRHHDVIDRTVQSVGYQIQRFFAEVVPSEHHVNVFLFYSTACS